MRRAFLIGLVLLGAAPAAAEIYRCRDANGGLRFTSDPRGCPGAEPIAPETERVATHPAPPVAPAEPAPVAIPAADLSRYLPPTPRGWEPTDEAVAIERDPAFLAQGMLASVARHYGRARGPVTEVCSVELWSFASAEQAAAAEAGLDRPRSWTGVSGTLVVIARGVRLEREVGSRRGLVPGCRELARSVDGNARRAPR